jgi:uncharacterized membrane protein YwaF
VENILLEHCFVLLIKSENIMLNIFLQLSKREARSYTAHLPFHISEMHLVSARISLLLMPHGLEV